MIIGFLEGINHPVFRNQKLKLIYLREWVNVSGIIIIFLVILSNIILVIVTLILIFNKNMEIEQKFGFFSIAFILIGVYAYSILVSLILFSFVILLLVPYINQDKKGIDFIKSNKYQLMGLISISAIFLMPSDGLIYEYIELLNQFPFVILINLRYIFLLLIMIISIGKLYFKEDQNEINKIMLDNK